MYLFAKSDKQEPAELFAGETGEKLDTDEVTEKHETTGNTDQASHKLHCCTRK